MVIFTPLFYFISGSDLLRDSQVTSYLSSSSNYSMAYLENPNETELRCKLLPHSSSEACRSPDVQVLGTPLLRGGPVEISSSLDSAQPFDKSSSVPFGAPVPHLPSSQIPEFSAGHISSSTGFGGSTLNIPSSHTGKCAVSNIPSIANPDGSSSHNQSTPVVAGAELQL